MEALVHPTISVLIIVILLVVVISIGIKYLALQISKKIIISDIDKMTGTQFEEYLTKLFTNLGYKATLTKGSGDFGVDLVLKKGEQIIAVQAKRYRNKVNLKAVQEVYSGKAYYGATEAWVVTNSFFADSAKNLAKCNDVKLIDRYGLQKLIKKGRR